MHAVCVRMREVKLENFRMNEYLPAVLGRGEAGWPWIFEQSALNSELEPIQRRYFHSAQTTLAWSKLIDPTTRVGLLGRIFQFTGS